MRTANLRPFGKRRRRDKPVAPGVSPGSVRFVMRHRPGGAKERREARARPRMLRERRRSGWQHL